MAPLLGAILRKCFSLMAKGSQEEVRTVRAACERLIPSLRPYKGARITKEAQAALLPSLLDLLQAAGWLYPCFMPSSRLAASQQLLAEEAWGLCMHLAADLLTDDCFNDMAAFHQLLQARSSPQVPGVLVWVDDMAVQLMQGVVEGNKDAHKADTVSCLCSVWQCLTRQWAVRSFQPQSALMLLQPSLLRLLAHVALQPVPPPAADMYHGRTLRLAVCMCLSSVTLISGAVVEGSWYSARQLRRPLTSGGSSSSSHQLLTGPSNGPSAQQTAVVLELGGFWWSGVAAMAAVARGNLGLGQTDMNPLIPTLSCSSSSSSSSSSNSSSSSSGSGSQGTNQPAALCPLYHKAAAAPLVWSAEAKGLCEGWGGHCLELLLLREGLGHMPWALQQLKPFRAAQDASSSTTPARGADVIPIVVQWPMTQHLLNRDSSSSGGGGDGGGGGGACTCGSLACHLCTPPPPVTLQQLRMLLEVVCLSHSEGTPQAGQAPVLLALLLQRADPGVRAAFLNSEDGTRLLAALQLAVPASSQGQAKAAWSFYNRVGALSLCDISREFKALPWQFPAASRVVFTLAWCLFEVDPDTAAVTAAAMKHAAAGGVPAAVLAPAAKCGPAAVADGSVLCVSGWCWAACIHLLGFPSTSLRLAAGVQPSLALFATLEALLRRTSWDTLPLLLATLLAAVMALLEPDGHNSSTNSSSSSSSSSVGAPLPGVLQAVASVAVSVSKVLCSVGTSTQGRPEARAELQVQREVVLLSLRLSNTVTQLALQQLQRLHRHDHHHHHQQQQQQQQAVSRRDVMQLVHGAQRLVRHCAGAANADIQEQTHCMLAEFSKSMASADMSRRVQEAYVRGRPTDRPPTWIELLIRDQIPSSRQLLMQVHTGGWRLAALHKAAAEAAPPRAEHLRSLTAPPAAAAAAAATAAAVQAAGRATAALGAPAAQAGTGCTIASAAPAGAEVAGSTAAGAAAAAAAVAEPADHCTCVAAGTTGGTDTAQSSLGHDRERVDSGTWCPVHSHRPSPVSVQVGETTEEGRLYEYTVRLCASLANLPTVRVQLLGCSYAGCNILAGPSEAGLVANGKGVLCGVCGVVRYCGPACAKLAWPAHSRVCRRLGAALGRDIPITTTSTHNASSSSSSSSRGPTKPTVPAASSSGNAAAAPAVQGPVVGTSSGTQAAAAGSAPLQGPASTDPVCAWCGASSQELLRCGRCKQVWYCGVAHQKAAWKAGHKQECAAAGPDG